jgi:UDP-N-acetylmuramate--alanine ligase
MIAIAPCKRVHFVGIGGAGMSGLARVLAGAGFRVSGSDRQASDVTRRLSREGIRMQSGHGPALVKNADLLVYSSAVKASHPEREWARRHGINAVRRAELLGDLTRGHFSVCVAGTHGKTTTTSLCAQVLIDAGKDPTALIGGVPRGPGTNARAGAGALLVAEADEFDRSVLALYPSAAIITNIEAEHLDCYRDLADIKRAFVAFTDRLPFYGAAIVCADDPGARSILPEIKSTVITYGFDASAHYRATILSMGPASSRFSVACKGRTMGTLTLGVPGRHNISNAMGVIALATELGIGIVSIRATCRAFPGVERRFEILAARNGITIIDDYAHHPGEIRATLSTAHACGFTRIIAVFQPHLYTRTRDFLADFAAALSTADCVIVTSIYASREDPLPGVSAERIADLINRRHPGRAMYVENRREIPAHFAGMLRKGDAALFMGAGDITETARECAKALHHA